MTALPSGRVTFLFTDIEGSTQLLHRLGEGYVHALADHRRIMRVAFAAHGGAEVDTQGDAFLVAFAHASDAVAAAQDAQRALASSPVRVRMGIHTGEPLLTPEGYVGLDVHRGARICAAGHGGQVLISWATRALIDPHTELRDLGEHRLKDLPAPEWLFQLIAPDLEDQFPPLRSLNNTNLPSDVSSLVGRSRELVDLGALLDRDDVRLVTLTGPGGAGKTRLALRLAADSVERFRNGVFLVALGGLADARLVVSTIMQTLGVRELPDATLLETLSRHLASRSMLLVLDNFEQLLEAAPDIGQVLTSTSQLKLIVTSRERLHLTGEQEYPVPPLPEDEAIALFVERARAVDPSFRLDGDSLTIATICRRLDRLPLAIELAAARTKILSAQALLERLESRLPLLVGGPRDQPKRHRTLTSTIAWSYDLLSPAERRLFARLSVFSGGCTLEAAEAVASADLETVSSLLEKSLVRREGQRYLMLETIREFALGQLREGGEAETFQKRHADHYNLMVSRLDPLLRSGEQLDALARLEGELDNVRVALGWSVSAEERRIALSICASMCWYWFMRSRNSEAQHWLGFVVGDLAGAADREAATVLAWAGFLAFEQGRNAEASSLGEAGLLAARRTRDPATIVSAILLFSPNRALEKDTKTLHDFVEEAIDVATRSGEAFLLAWAHSFVGEVFRAEDREDDALAHYTLSIDFGRSSGDRLFLSTSLMNSAHIHLKRANVDLAYELLAESLETFGALGMHWGVAYTLIGLAGVAAARGRSDIAVTLLAAVDAWFGGTGIQIQPADRADFDQYLAGARSALDQIAFARAWEKGQTLTLDYAVQFATAGGKTASTV
jgi:predicted ATPase/class 3 adenylate cyclase